VSLLQTLRIQVHVLIQGQKCKLISHSTRLDSIYQPTRRTNQWLIHSQLSFNSTFNPSNRSGFDWNGFTLTGGYFSIDYLLRFTWAIDGWQSHTSSWATDTIGWTDTSFRSGLHGGGSGGAAGGGGSTCDPSTPSPAPAPAPAPAPVAGAARPRWLLPPRPDGWIFRSMPSVLRRRSDGLLLIILLCFAPVAVWQSQPVNESIPTFIQYRNSCSVNLSWVMDDWWLANTKTFFSFNSKLYNSIRFHRVDWSIELIHRLPSSIHTN